METKKEIPIAKENGYSISVTKGKHSLIDIEGIYAEINGQETNAGRLTMTKQELFIFMKHIKKAQMEMRR